MQQQKRLQDDIARITAPQRAAEAAHARSAPARFQELQEQRRLAYEQAAVQRQVREMDLRQRYGQRAGGFLAGAERLGQSRLGQAAMGGVTAFGAFAGNAARSGFQGTVEANRLAFEWQLLNREFASAFKPVIEWFTWGVSRVRRFMQGLDGTGQQFVRIAGLLAGAYGTIRVARTVGGALGLAGGAGGLGGVGSALLGGGAVAATGAATGAAGATTASTAAAPVAATATVAGAAGGLRAKAGGVASAVTRGTLFAAPLFDAERGYSIGGNALRAARANTQEERMAAGVDTLRDIKQNGGPFAGLGLDKLFLESGYAKRRLAEAGVDLDKPTAGQRGTPRDQVTPDQFGYEEVGSAYKRASVSFLSTTPAEDVDKTLDMSSVAQIIRDGLAKNAELLDQIRQQGVPKGEVR